MGSISLGLVVCFALGQAEPPRFVAHDANGAMPAGPLVELAEDWSARIGSNKPGRVAGKELVALRHATQPLPAPVDKNFLWLTSGDRFALDEKALCRLDQDRLYFRPAPPLSSRDELSLSVNYATVLWLDNPPGIGDAELFLQRLHQEVRPRDVVFLRNGDRVEGTLKAIKNDVRLQVNGVDRQLPFAQVAGIAFNTELRAGLKSKGPYGHVVLAGGSRIGLTKLHLDGARKTLIGNPLFGGKVELLLDDVRALDVRQGPAVYLSDLTPRSFEHTPFLGVSWPLVKDATATGKLLRLGPNTFDKGLGMHAASKATYKLDGKYRWFEAVVGLDEREGQLGRVHLKVLVDGKEHDLGVRSTQLGPLPVRLAVNKAQQLTLQVEFANFGDVQANVNWADARLVK